MKKILEIELNSNSNKIEDYAKDFNNLMHIDILLPNGERVNSQNYSVEMILTEDGLLGLGTELIRKAIRLKQGETSEIQELEQLLPFTESGGCADLGAIPTQSSCQLVLCVGPLYEKIPFTRQNIHYTTDRKSKGDKIFNLFQNKQVKSTEIHDIRTVLQIELSPNLDKIEDYEINENNFMKLTVRMPDNKLVSGCNIEYK